jgi:hypothetical protein
MTNSEKTNKARRPFFRWLARPVSSVLVVILLATAMPPRASAKWQQQSLPGTVSTGEVVGALAGLGVVIGVLVYYKIHHKQTVKLHVDHDAAAFADLPPGQPANKTVPIRNSMSEPVNIVSVSIEDTSRAFALGSLPSFPHALAPGESLDVPLTVSPIDGSGSARLRVVASSARAKSQTEIFKVSYGHPKTKKKILGIIP